MQLVHNWDCAMIGIVGGTAAVIIRVVSYNTVLVKYNIQSITVLFWIYSIVILLHNKKSFAIRAMKILQLC